MAGTRSLGDWIQKLLFTTTFTDIAESIDSLRQRIEELDQKLDREVASLRTQVAEAQAKAGGDKKRPTP